MPSPTRTFLLLLMILALPNMHAAAQILHTPVSMAMGGGGTAYTTGYESLFINPANLYIQEKNYRLQLSAGSAGVYMQSPLPNRTVHRFRERYLGYSETYRTDIHTETIDFESILRNEYGNRQDAEHQSTGEIHWFGIHWAHLDKSYAIAARSRFANRTITGRGYYDPVPVEAVGEMEINRNLDHQYQSLHEISFGYAESFSFLNDMIPQLSQLIIGIAPKFVMSGSYQNTRYRNVYSPAEEDFRRDYSYLHRSSGEFTKMSNRFRLGEDPLTPAASPEDLFRPTGFGAGLDVGITYLITLGDDLSVLRVTDPRTRKSLRLSFSVTDIGLVHYIDQPFSTSQETTETEGSLPPGSSETLFMGYPGEQIPFLAQNQGHPLKELSDHEFDAYSVLLPTALNAGALFQVNRLKMTADISLGLTDNAFNTTRFAAYLGTEIRPLPFLPLRAGARLTRNMTDYYSLGAGLETRYFDISASIQLRNRSFNATSDITGISMGAIKIYIP